MRTENYGIGKLIVVCRQIGYKLEEKNYICLKDRIFPLKATANTTLLLHSFNRHNSSSTLSPLRVCPFPPRANSCYLGVAPSSLGHEHDDILHANYIIMFSKLKYMHV